MIKTLILFFFMSKTYAGTYLTTNNNVPTEIKLLINCLPKDLDRQKKLNIKKSINESFSIIPTRNLNFLIKSELYKLIVKNIPSELEQENNGLNKDIKENCAFSQWIFYSSNKKSPWRKILRNSKNEEKSLRKVYLKYLNHLIKMSSIFASNIQKTDKGQVNFIEIKEKKVDKKALEINTQEANELIDNLFKSNK